MPILLPERLPWFLAGPALGLIVVFVYALANRKLGVTGSYSGVVSLFRGVTVDRWQLWLFGGIAAGGLLASILRGGPIISLEYGVLGLAVPLAVLVPVLFAGGVLIGYGARWAGGCTSGHGIAGIPAWSAGSLVATMTFMATAVALTFGIRALTGGAW